MKKFEIKEGGEVPQALNSMLVETFRIMKPGQYFDIQLNVSCSGNRTVVQARSSVQQAAASVGIKVKTKHIGEGLAEFSKEYLRVWCVTPIEFTPSEELKSIENTGMTFDAGEPKMKGAAND